MIARIRILARLVGFAALLWIVAVALLGLATGAKHIETPHLAVWLFIGAIVTQLILWFVSKVARRT